MDCDEPPSEPASLLALSVWLATSQPGGWTLPVFLLLLLLICSALVSGSEVAFFSLDQNAVDQLEQEENKSARRILKLLKEPQELLGTILVANNLINIAIVILSALIVSRLLPEDIIRQWSRSTVEFTGISGLGIESISALYNVLLTTVLATFILVLIGEIIPKVYASSNALPWARAMARPLQFLKVLLYPISYMLVRGSSALTERFYDGSSLQSQATREDIDKAIELTVEEGTHREEEVDMLKGIINISDVPVKQIMRNRTDMVGLDLQDSIEDVLAVVREHGYSRLPVYNEDIDAIEGILYVKDLIGVATDTTDWKGLVRPSVMYVPENKRLNELLRDFQLAKTHLAVVVDEYGGTAGLVTLEDILEEVVGDIKDEFDSVEDQDYVQIDENNYVFDGKTLINDFCRIVDVPASLLDDHRGEADSLAGMILELNGYMPRLNQSFTIAPFQCKILAVNKRRIQQIKVTIDRDALS